mmetsp:Transcript_13535/g.36175  ORF Transcript_13535/g.36175 Transcript_13535/m.36175 type:complete len:238 (+) Transcript_13535:55-768(+)
MASARKFNAVLWDMDGVLVDVSGSYRRAIVETAEAFIGAPVEAGTVQRFKNMGGFNDDWKLTAAIIEEAGKQVAFQDVVDAFQKRYKGDNFNGFIATEPALIDDKTIPALHDLGYDMSLVTGRPEDEARWTLRRLGLDQYLPVVIAMEQQEGKGKPNPFPMQKAMSEMKPPVDPAKAVYIGDTGDDMVAARAAGMHAVGVIPPYLEAEAHEAKLRECGAHAVLRSPNELVAYLASVS